MKKTISILLIVAMMLASVIAIIPASAAPRGEAIKTADDFANMDPEGEYYLANDIVIKTSYAEEFKGRFDGDGHTITVFSATPVFDKVVGGRVTALNINMSFEEAIPAGGNFGALARVAKGTFARINVTANFKFTGKTSGTNIGGAIGQINGESTLTTIVVRGSIAETVANGDATNTSIGLGGIVGYISADADIRLAGCVNYADIANNETRVSTGGIVGCMSGETRLTIDNSQNYGNITFINTVGGGHVGSAGVLGHVVCASTKKASVEVTNTRNYGDVTCSGTAADHMTGGIVGRVYGIRKVRIDGCVNSGNITGTAGGWASQGGILANIETYNYTWSQNTEADIRISNCVNTGAIKGNGEGNGGIFGTAIQINSPNVKIQILSSANYGKISGNRAAGIMGQQGIGGGGNELIIKDCYNKGEATAGIINTLSQGWATGGDYSKTQDKKLLGNKTFGEGESATDLPTTPYVVPKILNCVSDSGAIIGEYKYTEFAAAGNPMAGSKVTVTNCVGSVPSGATYEVTAPEDSAATTAATKAAVPGNPSELDALLADYSGAVSTDYEAGWDAFIALYNAAIVDVNKASSQEKLDAHIPALEEAIDALVVKEVDLQVLEDAIDAADAIIAAEGDAPKYTPRTWDAYLRAVADAKALYEEADGVDSDVKISDIDNSIANLNLAYSVLELIPDKTALEATIAKYEAYDSTIYVTSSWATLVSAINAAKKVVADENAVKADVDSANKAVKNAAEALVKKANPASLGEKAEKVLKDYPADKYTAKSYNDVKTVANQIKAAVGANDISQIGINEYAAALDEAVANLVLRGNFDEIDALIEPFGELIYGTDKPAVDTDLVEELEDTYTRGSVKNFSSILTNIADSKKKENLPNFSENDAARLLKALQNAIDGLVPYASYADIDVKLAEISALDKTAYTEESWAALDAAVKAVAELKQNRNASKPQSDSALTALNTALEGRVKVVVEEAPVVEEESGCKSAIGATIVVMTATLALGATTLLKKKED